MESSLEQRIKHLSPEMQTRLVQRLKGAKPAAHRPTLHKLPRQKTKNSFPLSFAQERMWFLDQLAGSKAVYNTVSPFRLLGTLNRDAMAESLNEIARRHEILRTTFVEAGETLQQIIAPSIAIPLPLIDLSGLPEAEQAHKVQKIILADSTHRLCLTEGPLLQAKLIRLAEEEHIFSLTVHHIIADGWSYNILIEELVRLYNAFSQGQPSPLAELPIQYADYAVWQRAWLQGETFENALSYWQQKLDGVPAMLDLPADRPRSAIQSTTSAITRLTLPASLSHRLKAFCHQESLTPFMVLLGAFQILLYRYTGQEDIIVGSPVANRVEEETAMLIGCFMNPLPMYTNLAGNPTFQDFLQRVRATTLGAYSHQALPFEVLVKNLHVERSLNRMPLFQTIFILNNMETPALGFQGLESTEISITQHASEYDLTIAVYNTEQEIYGIVEYNAELLDASTIERMLGHYETLLVAALSDPGQKIDQLPLLSQAERQQILIQWNATQATYPPSTLTQCFEAQAANGPDRLAVTDDHQRLTYRDLNQRANQLGHYLRKLGVAPGTLVAISLGRGVEMVVGLLGILKAGGAYVPLDPNYPDQRLAFMLEDTQPKVLLTQARLLETLPQGNATAVCIDRDGDLIRLESQENFPAQTCLDDLAYIIYTSGSTGKPKGVQVCQRGLINFLSSMQAQPGLTASDKLLAVTTLSFDIAGLELYLPLVSGAQVIIASRETAMDGAQLIKKLVESEASIMQATPATWRMLLASGWPGTPKLKALCGGEALSRDLADALLARCAEVWNLYGPTETTIWSTVGRVESGKGNISIGKPIANTQIYILDAHANPQPVGVPGEMYIAGTGLARGYLNRAELTNEKFISHAFSAEQESRLYRTGDLARWLPNGEIECLGRNDSQVKIRGFRIELGEIEAALQEHSAIRQALVIAREDIPGDQRLVAYLAVHQQPAPASTDLRDFLKDRLPAYMIPSAMVVLERFPLTPAGKIDRKALPAPTQADIRSQRSYSPARTPSEQILVKIWSEMLGVEQIGIEDNFFELGGHSLLATRVLSRIQKDCQQELSLQTFFKSRTLAELAEQIDRQREIGQDIPETPLLPARRDAALPLSFSQQWMWFLTQLEPDNPSHNIPAAIRLRGALDQDALLDSLNALVQRHEVLRTTFPLVDQQPLQCILPQLRFDLPVFDFSALPESERNTRARQAALSEANQSFDLAHGPLIRACLLRLAEEDFVLMLTIHHMVCDGWSIGILIRELSVLYRAYLEKQAAGLPELPVQYADYAAWQRARLQGDRLEKQLAYWKRQLAGAPALRLPTDQARTAVQTFRGGHQSLVLPDALQQAIKTYSQREGVTPFMTLLAAFQALLYRYSGQTDFVVGTPTANRGRAESEGLIGFFANTLALRADLSGNPTFAQLLKRVQETTIEAYAHQDLPYEMLVESIQPRQGLSYTPLFQVMFILQNAISETLSLPGLTWEKIEVERGIARFDLTVSFSEGPQQGLAGEIEYNTGLFGDSRIEQMARHYETLLGLILTHPTQQIDALPLPSDMEALRALAAQNGRELSGSHLARHYVPARTAVEKELVKIWADVLGVERVGIYDNFFELGGHSLLATQVVSRLRQTFHKEMQLLHFFEAPTIAEVAQAIESLRPAGETAPQQTPEIRRAGRERYRLTSLPGSASSRADTQN